MKKGDRVVAASGPARAYFSRVVADYLEVHDTAHPDLVVIKDYDGLWRVSDFVLLREAQALLEPAAKAQPATPENEHARRKARPLARGLVYYFPDALRLVAAAISSDGQIPFRGQISSLVADGHHESVALLVLAELQQYLTGRPVQRGADMWGTFREALLEVAAVSVSGNEQHHPGAPLHWEKDKSRDHADCILRHWADHQALSVMDSDGLLHLAKAAWRALAWLQAHLERQNPKLAAERDALRAACASGTEL